MRRKRRKEAIAALQDDVRRLIARVDVLEARLGPGQPAGADADATTAAPEGSELGTEARARRAAKLRGGR
jgi:hypothetical protein